MTWIHVREGSWCLMIKGRGRKGVYGEGGYLEDQRDDEGES